MMYDRETGTLWSHITGEALAGPLKGQGLRMLSALPQVLWKDWRANYPQSQVLSVNGREDSEWDSYASYKRSSEPGVRPGSGKDRRLPPKEMVMGIKVGKNSWAFPLKDFTDTSLITFSIAGEPLLLFHDKTSLATGVFKARVKGETLQFPSKTKGYLAKDTEGNEWNLLTGLAIKGQRRGQRLERVPYFLGYWFAWSDFHPESQIGGRR